MNRLEEEFISKLNLLVGQKCWSYRAGKATGSIISFDFGQKIKRDLVLKGRPLSFDQRNYIGEYGLMIWCAWRLDGQNQVICGWNDSNEQDGPMLSGLGQIVNKSVVNIEVGLPAYDLVINFDDSLFLKIFCDQTDPKENYENYTFFTSDFTYTVEAAGFLTRATRSIDPESAT